MEQLYGVKDLCALLKVSRAQVYKLINNGVIPPPIYVGPRSPRWSSSQLKSVLENLAKKGEVKAKNK